jgi:hypothetical protein
MAPLLLADSNPADDLWKNWSRFIPRLSRGDRALLEEFPGGTIAKPLLQASADAQLVLDARSAPSRRVVLEPQGWRNELPRLDRHAEFNSMRGVSLAGELDPATLRSARASALIQYTESFILAEEERGSDALVLPSHVAGGHGEARREGELRLAEAGVAVVRRGGYSTRGDRQKPLLVGITIDVTALASPHEGVMVARSYAEIGGDGYWVQPMKLNDTTPATTVSRAAAFLFALEELSGRPVFAVDCKNLTWPFLAAGLSGACIGVGEREQFDGPQSTSTVRRGFKPTVVHPRLLRSFQVGSAQALKAFGDYPCECGVHEPEQMPTEKPDIRRHALRVRLRMAREATGAQGVAAVRTWLKDAGWAAAELGLDQPASAAYEAVFNAADWRSAASL